MSEEKVKCKSCFIITPIGDGTSEVRRKADGVIKSVVEPVLKELGFENVEAAHGITTPGSINTQVMTRILEDDLVIANLTGLNPNVMYEVAVRHATQKPIVHIFEKGTKIPFDIAEQRSIMYTNDMLGVEELKSTLESFAQAAIDSGLCSDNPIYRAQKEKIILDSVKPGDSGDIIKYVVSRIDELEMAIKNERNSNTIKPRSFRKQKFKIDFDHDFEELNDNHEQIYGDIRNELENTVLIASASTSYDSGNPFVANLSVSTIKSIDPDFISGVLEFALADNWRKHITFGVYNDK